MIRSFVLPLLMAMTIGMMIPGAAYPYSQADVESQALTSLNDAYTLLIDPAVDTTPLKLVGTVKEGDHATVDVAGRVAEISRFRAAAAFYGTRVTGAKVTLVDSRVETRGNQIILHVMEDTVLSFEVGNRGPRPEDVTRQRLPHEFVFELTAGAWTLVFDRPAWPHSTGGAPGPRPVQPLLAHQQSDKTPGSVASPGGIETGGGMKVLAKPLSAWGTYRWLDAVYYAHTYAFSYNPAYTAYALDCANFMSQALFAGGWTFTSFASSTDPNLWWYDDLYDQNSNTWSVADWLINFVYTSGRGYSLAAFTDLYLGDVVFADWAYNGTPGVPEHSMMLTYKTSNDYGDIRFTYHTTDRYDYPLSLILASNPTPSNLYWGSRIAYTTN